MSQSLSFDDVILCGPDSFRLQGKCTVDSNGILIASEETAFQIHFRKIDRFILIPSSQPTTSSNSNSVGTSSSLQRRFGTTTFPPINWHTLSIETKEFLIFEISMLDGKKADILYKAILDYSKMQSIKYNEDEFDVFRPSALEDHGWEEFSPEHDFAQEINNGIVRISRVNKDFRVCPTYSESVVVPVGVNDEILKDASIGRRGFRFPVVKYYHSPKSTFLATAAESTVISGNKINQVPIADDSTSSLSPSIQSMASTRCRANEKLLEAMLPRGGRGLIIDLRSDNSSTIVGKSKKKEIKRNRELSPIIESNIPKNTQKRWHLIRSIRASEVDQFCQCWKRVSKPLPDVSEIASIFTDFIRNIIKPTEVAPQQTTNSTFASSTGYNLSSFLPSSNADLSYASRSSISSNTPDEVSDGNCAFAGVKVSLKKTSAWHGLIRDTLAAAVAGACALDGRDLAAQHQLNQERAKLARPTNGVSDNERLARLADMTTSGASLLIISEDGRDRCLVVSSLVQVILSPAVRTIRGFEALIQRDWISGGHPFLARCSHLLVQSSDAKFSDTGPVFLLFLDCIWQIWCQYPSSFEFNEELLLLLVKHAYVSEFGTFLGDSDEMRKSTLLSTTMPSLWSYVESPEVISKIRNCLYVPPGENADPETTSCWPCLSPQALNIWREVYQRVLLPYPCRIWSDERETLARAFTEYSDALKQAQFLEKTVRDLIEEASSRDLLPAK